MADHSLPLGGIAIIIGAMTPADPGQARADADYFGNLKKFERHEDVAATPTRDNERGRDQR